MSGSVTVGIYANLLSTANSICTSTTDCSNITAGGATSTALAVDAAGTSGTGAVTGTSATLTSAVELQKISPMAGTLTVSLGASNPVAANVLAGASSLEVGDFSSQRTTPTTLSRSSR